MAPRKKRTAAKNTKSKRGRPKLPDGDFNTSMTVEEQQDKLKNYIQEYQVQVKGNLEIMRKYIQTAKGLITNLYRSTTVELLKAVKEMTMEEFMAKGGTVDTAITAQVHATITGMVTNPATALVVPPSGRMPLANVSNNIEIAGLSLDQSSVISQISASNVQTAGKSTRKRKVNTESKPPPTGTRSSRRLQAKSSVINNEVTPMPNMNTLSVINQHMFITPKFDPRLPIPAKSMREPKAGERIVSMDGSPLTNNTGLTGVKSAAPHVVIPLTGGKTMQLSVDDKLSMNEQDIDVANDSVAQQNIRLLQEKLSKLLKMPKDLK